MEELNAVIAVLVWPSLSLCLQALLADRAAFPGRVCEPSCGWHGGAGTLRPPDYATHGYMCIWVDNSCFSHIV
jgi:hypothetical protein